MRNISFYIAKRYFFSSANTNAVNIITFIAVGAILVATAALFVILSVFTGLEKMNLKFYSNVNPEIKVSPAKGKVLSDIPKLEDLLKKNDYIKSYSKVIEEKIYIDYNGMQDIAYLKGVDEKNRVWNFVLLDRNTNRSYKNAIFPAKRRIIISRSQGYRTDIIRCNKESDVHDNYKRIGNTPFYVVTTSGEQSFVPPCTMNAFLKFHTLSSSNLLAWTKADAQAYEDSIFKVLHDAKLM